jgi:signal transduction histidine kinase
LFKFSFTQQKRFLFTILAVGICLLLLASTFSWIYLKRIETFYITELKLRIQNIIMNAQQMINPAHMIELMQGEPATPLYIYYQQRIYEILENNQLQSVSLISPVREVVLTTSPEPVINPASAFLNDTLVSRILAGKMVVGHIQTLGQHKFITAGAPLIDPTTNQITGAIIIEVRASFFDILEKFNKSLILLSLLNVLLILSVAILLLRTFRRVIFLQDQIKNQEHMVKLGEMAAVVAHEIRNPLGIIKGTHTLIAKRYKQQNDELFTYIPAEVDRLNKLITDYLSFARIKKVHYQQTDLQELLDKIRLTCDQRKRIQFQFDLPEELKIIKTDSDLLEQILLNIITNGCQAIKKEGEIKVSCSTAGKFLKISVNDSGCGISPEEMEKIFEPFYSTKESGSGLGLSIAQGLIEALGGSIYVKSKAGKGTEVILQLPYK